MSVTTMQPSRGVAPARSTRDVAFANIPAALKALPQWVLWRVEERDGKKTKVPYTTLGRRAAVNAPATWTTFDCVWRALLHDDRYAGIGFALATGADISVVDLDKCIDENGVAEPWVERVVERLDSYAEISPSGRGLHIFLQGQLPPGRRRRGRVEMYDRLRFITVTGWTFGTPRAFAERTEAIARLHRKIAQDDMPIVTRPIQSAPTPDDAELITKAMSAKNGNKFARLWHGDLSAHHGDHSSADLALARILAYWTGGDVARIDRLFRQSNLFRKKWDHRRGCATYGQLTIARVVRNMPSSQLSLPAKTAG